MEPKSENKPGDEEQNYQRPECDWRDPSKPWNPEDDEIVDGWRRRADGTWERVEQDEEDIDERFPLPEHD